MSREIKFRAYDKERKKIKFFDLKEIYADCYHNVGFLKNAPHQHENDGWEQFELMQFTGLKDKNGKEVFEGDVIKIKCNEDIIIGDVFYNQSRCCYMINHPAGYNGFFGLHTLTIEICDEFNIIGNIFQNPELLGGEND